MPAPLRVLHLCAGNLYGGIERIVAECARSRALCASMAPSFALCFDGRLARELESFGVRAAHLGDVRARRPWTILRARRRLAAILQAGRPHAIICHSSWAFALAAPVVRRTSATLVLWLHDRVSGRTWVERCARRTKPDLVISNSAFTAETVPALYATVPHATLYAPVSMGGSPAASSVASLRASLGVRDRTPVILIASRFEAWKGHPELLQATARIDEPWAIWIAGGAQRPGEQAYERSLREMAVRLGIGGRVRFLGERSDVSGLMFAADVLCQPNTGAEPFGLAFVEALHAGLPVVTSAMGGASEILTDACGVLVPPGDLAALEHALRTLLADAALRGRLGAAGPERATLLCDPATQLAGLAALLSGRPIAPAAA